MRTQSLGAACLMRKFGYYSYQSILAEGRKGENPGALA